MGGRQVKALSLGRHGREAGMLLGKLWGTNPMPLKSFVVLSCYVPKGKGEGKGAGWGRGKVLCPAPGPE